MKNKELNSDYLLSLYGDYLLENRERPKSVYSFAKENKFEEKEFYQFFSSFDHLEKEILKHFFQKSLDLTIEIQGYEEMSAKERLLNLYFIFFENLTMNRSLVTMILEKRDLTTLQKMQKLKSEHQAFIKTLDFNDLEILEKAKESFKNFNSKSREEILWLHFLSIIEFWQKDESPNFEKTDLYIEKTIDTGFQFIDHEPLKKFVDLGKFLWKEKFQKI
ncbi:TetR/AcrR family transcriptional regulator [Soonwooa sp.]|uniref:TetR/AcrR family transcriptional regulator n=1 Tax=Soonwooa sp. TaxID=1938592 RepID=UPI0028A6D50A|nr:TetR/AcrR family transcriptional regulator [Soonwooa sp.]